MDKQRTALTVTVCLAALGGVGLGLTCLAHPRVAGGAQGASLTASSNADVGYPELIGFDGRNHLLLGIRPKVPYAVLSERQHQVNLLAGSLLPAANLGLDRWVLGYSLRYEATVFTVQLQDVQQVLLETYTDPTSAHPSKQRMRYNGPLQELLKIELNGEPVAVPVDAIPDGGLTVMSEDVVIYLPGVNAVNPGDAGDRPVAVFKTPAMEFTIYLESEDHLHLDLKTELLTEQPLAMHGIMGQTLAWRGTDSRKDIEGHSPQPHNYMASMTRFVLLDGFMGTSFRHSLFAGSIAFVPFGHTSDSGVMAVESHAQNTRRVAQTTYREGVTTAFIRSGAMNIH